MTKSNKQFQPESSVSAKAMDQLLVQLLTNPGRFEIVERLYRQSYEDALVAYLCSRDDHDWQGINLESELIAAFMGVGSTPVTALNALMEDLGSRKQLDPKWIEEGLVRSDDLSVVEPSTLWAELSEDFKLVEGSRDWYVFRRKPRNQF